MYLYIIYYITRILSWKKKENSDININVRHNTRCRLSDSEKVCILKNNIYKKRPDADGGRKMSLYDENQFRQINDIIVDLVR